MAKLCLGTPLPANFPPPTIYLGLSSTVPTKRGTNITEPSGGAYARQPLITSPTLSSQFGKLGPTNPGIYQNLVGVQFPLPTAQWATTPMQAVCAFDALTNGNFLCWASQLYFPVQANQYGASIYFPPGWLRFGVKPFWNRRGSISEYFADLLASWFWRGTSITWPSLWAALCDPMPGTGDTGATIIEPSGPVSSSDAAGACYSRQFLGTSWARKLPGRYANSGTIIWPYPTSSPL